MRASLLALPGLALGLGIASASLWLLVSGASDEPDAALLPLGRRAARDTTVAGRVVEDGTGRPVHGVRVELHETRTEVLSARGDSGAGRPRVELQEVRERVLSEAHTDADGRFTLTAEASAPRPGAVSSVRIEVDPPHGLRSDAPPREVRLGEREVVLRLQAASDDGLAHPAREPATPRAAVPELCSASLRGRLVDTRSGAPLAGVELRFLCSVAGAAQDAGSGWLSELVTTDAAGRFETRRAFPRATIGVDGRVGRRRIPIDAPTHAHLGADDARCEWILAAHAGPAYRVRIVGPDAAAPRAWRARLVERAPDGERREWSWQPLCDDDGLCVRFPVAEFPDDARHAARLELASVDGAFVGDAPVRSTDGVHPGELEIVARATARGAREPVAPDLVDAPREPAPARELASELAIRVGPETIARVLAELEGAGAMGKLASEVLVAELAAPRPRPGERGAVQAPGAGALARTARGAAIAARAAAAAGVAEAAERVGAGAPAGAERAPIVDALPARDERWPAGEVLGAPERGNGGDSGAPRDERVPAVEMQSARERGNSGSVGALRDERSTAGELSSAATPGLGSDVDARELPASILPDARTRSAAALASLGPGIRGTILCASGGDAPWAIVCLRSRERRGEARFQIVGAALARESLAGPGSFAFAEVPAGEYELCVLPPYDGAFQPVAVFVDAAADALEFSMPSCSRSRASSVRALDATTGAPVPGALVRIDTDALWGARRAVGDEALSARMPIGARFAWHVHADGYRPARGDQDAFPSGAGDALLDVRLEPGWGMSYRVEAAGEGGAPAEASGDARVVAAAALAGVEIVADGTCVGSTARDGGVFVSLAARPLTLEARKPGWRTLRAGEPGWQGELLRMEPE